MTIGSGIAILGIWGGVAISAVYAGPVAVGVAFFAFGATLAVASMN